MMTAVNAAPLGRLAAGIVMVALLIDAVWAFFRKDGPAPARRVLRHTRGTRCTAAEWNPIGRGGICYTSPSSLKNRCMMELFEDYIASTISAFESNKRLADRAACRCRTNCCMCRSMNPSTRSPSS